MPKDFKPTIGEPNLSEVFRTNGQTSIRSAIEKIKSGEIDTPTTFFIYSTNHNKYFKLEVRNIDLIEVTFQPGDVGLSLKNWIVKKIEVNGQAARAGIIIGSKIVKVDNVEIKRQTPDFAKQNSYCRAFGKCISKELVITFRQSSARSTTKFLEDLKAVTFDPPEIGLLLRNWTVGKVLPGKQAAKLGVKVGWSIVKVDGLEIPNDILASQASPLRTFGKNISRKLILTFQTICNNDHYNDAVSYGASKSLNENLPSYDLMGTGTYSDSNQNQKIFSTEKKYLKKVKSKKHKTSIKKEKQLKNVKEEIQFKPKDHKASIKNDRKKSIKKDRKTSIKEVRKTSIKKDRKTSMKKDRKTSMKKDPKKSMKKDRKASIKNNSTKKGVNLNDSIDSFSGYGDDDSGYGDDDSLYGDSSQSRSGDLKKLRKKSSKNKSSSRRRSSSLDTKYLTSNSSSGSSRINYSSSDLYSGSNSAIEKKLFDESDDFNMEWLKDDNKSSRRTSSKKSLEKKNSVKKNSKKKSSTKKSSKKKIQLKKI